MKKIKIALVKGVMRLMSKLPLDWLYGLGNCVTWFAKRVLHYREGVVMTNLARSFPEYNHGDLEWVADLFYKHIGEMVAEAIWFGGSDYERIRKQQICRMLNPEVLNDAFNSSPSVLVLNSHCGNWEILGGFCVYNDSTPVQYTEKDLFVVYKKLTNEVMNEVFKRNRVNCIEGYDGLIEASNLLRTVLKNKDRKGIYICNSDQYPYVGKFPLGTFLNQPTYAMKGVAGVAHKMNMSVVYMRMVNKARGKYEISFVKLCDDASQHDPEEIVRMYYSELEKEIRETPFNWLWSHKRWK
jgi:KDO2-lipid IV(A) lauroyltransferase